MTANTNPINTQGTYADDIEVRQLEHQPILSIRETIRTEQLSEVMGDWIPALLGYLRQSGAGSAGPVFVRYHTFGRTETDVEIGFPVVAPVAGAGRIATGTLPGGPAITLWHMGAHDDRLRDAYVRLGAWPQAHGRTPQGVSWEIYYWVDPSQNPDPATQPDPSTWRTQLVQPLK